MRALAAALLIALAAPVAAARPDAGIAPLIEERVLQLMGERADEWFHQGRYECSVQVYSMRQQYNPSDMESYATGAWLEWSAGYDELARETHLRMVKAEPHTYRPYFEIGLHWMGRRDDIQSCLWFSHAVIRGAPVDVWKALGHSFRKLGYYDQALAVFEHALELDPDDPTIPNNMGYIRELKAATAPSPAPAPER